MNLSDFLQVLRRRWLVALTGFLAVIAGAVGFLHIEKPTYDASVTLALEPASHNPIVWANINNTIPNIMPVFSEAVNSDRTHDLALAELPAGMPLASATATTFTDTPSIMRITATSTDPVAAARSARAYFDALQSQLADGSLSDNTLVKMQLISQDPVPTTPSSPHKSLTLAIAVLLGLVVAAAAAYLRETLGSKIENADTLSAVADLPVFGEVPEARRVARAASIDGWLSDESLRFVHEAMRDLSLTLQLTHFDADSVLITSPEGRHGKTTVAFGIAVALARSGVDTLLVDGDLRRGRVEELFADELTHPIRKTPGLADVLQGMPLEDAVQQTSLPHLSVLASGRLMDDPSQLLDVAFPGALRAMERRSAVVIDGTPLVPINDARVIAKFAGSTILVAASGVATRAQVRRALDRIRIIGVAPSAVVFNRARQRNSAAYSHYLAPKSTPAAPAPAPTLRPAAARAGALSRTVRTDDNDESATPDPGPHRPDDSPRVSIVNSEDRIGASEPATQEWPGEGWRQAQQP